MVRLAEDMPRAAMTRSVLGEILWVRRVRAGRNEMQTMVLATRATPAERVAYGKGNALSVSS